MMNQKKSFCFAFLFCLFQWNVAAQSPRHYLLNSFKHGPVIKYGPVQYLNHSFVLSYNEPALEKITHAVSFGYQVEKTVFRWASVSLQLQVNHDFKADYYGRAYFDATISGQEEEFVSWEERFAGNFTYLVFPLQFNMYPFSEKPIAFFVGAARPILLRHDVNWFIKQYDLDFFTLEHELSSTTSSEKSEVDRHDAWDVFFGLQFNIGKLEGQLSYSFGSRTFSLGRENSFDYYLDRRSLAFQLFYPL